ncbi:MAG: protein kinase [Planctomycetota bacterium]
MDAALLGGRFRLEAELARGGFGAVFAARDELSGDEVVVKLLLRAACERALARFLREGELARRLHHPGIVPLRACGAGPGGQPFLAYERVQGAALDEAWRGWEARRRVRCLVEVARALGAAHAQGVVHRDVKPENILVDAAGHPRLIDFGIALVTSDERLTQTGGVLGTPAYMSPEQLGGRGQELGPSADVWAVGVLLHQALSDALPFEGASYAELAVAIVGARPAPLPAAAVRELPGAPELLARLLAKDPAARPADGEVLAAALLALLGDRDGGRGRARHAPALLGAALGALALLGAGLALRLGADRAAARSEAPLVARSPSAAQQDPAAQGARAALLAAARTGGGHALEDALRDERARPALPAALELYEARVAALAAAATPPLDDLERALDNLGQLRRALGGPKQRQPLTEVVFLALDRAWQGLPAARRPAVLRALGALGRTRTWLPDPRLETVLAAEAADLLRAGGLDPSGYAAALLAFVELDLDISAGYFGQEVALAGDAPLAELVRRWVALERCAGDRAEQERLRRALRELLPSARTPDLGPVMRAKAWLGTLRNRGRGLDPDGIAATEEALRADPDSPHAHVARAACLIQRGEREPALATIEAGLRAVEQGRYAARGGRRREEAFRLWLSMVELLGRCQARARAEAVIADATRRGALRELFARRLEAGLAHDSPAAPPGE